MIDLALALDSALRAAGIPIDGVSIGKTADPSTWQARFTTAATPADRATAAALIQAFDPTSKQVRDAVDSKAATAMANSRQIRAFWLWFWRETHGGADPTDKDKTAATAALVQAYLDTPEIQP